jgi:hypothetical protein
LTKVNRLTIPVRVFGMGSGEFLLLSYAATVVCSSDGAVTKNLHGSYGFHVTGKNFVAVGCFVFDGDGGLAGKLFVRVPGTNLAPLETKTSGMLCHKYR